MKRSLDEMEGASSSTHPQYSIPSVKAHQIDAALRFELEHAFFCDTPNFPQTIFDDRRLHQLIETIYENCCSSQDPSSYDPEEGVWMAYPTSSPKTEKSLYEPFTNIANLITSFCPAPPASDSRRAISWTSITATKNLRSQRSYTVPVRPDIVATIGLPPIAEQDAEDPVELYWRHVLVPVEVKKTSVVRAAALQATQYLRQLFHENLDRRFAIGIVLAVSNMTVYLADRSGVIGSETFDIHTNPKLLIRVIAAIQVLPLHRLGWDTTMAVVGRKLRKHDRDPLLSYQLDFNYEDYAFVVSMPKPDPRRPGKMLPSSELFVLAEELSTSKAEVVKGRATRLWMVWRLIEMGIPAHERQVFILKDYWRHEQRISEGDLYAQVYNGHTEVPGIAKIHSYCDVVIYRGQKDTTTYIRGGLKPLGPSRRFYTCQPVIINEDRLAADAVSFKFSGINDLLPEEETLKVPQPRIHTRVVLATYGYSIKHFLTIRELVYSLSDIVNGLCNATKAGVIHRDVSVGNMLIIPRKKVNDPWGCLIDFDIGIPYLTHITVSGDELTGTLPFMSAELLLEKHYFLPLDPIAQASPPKFAPIHDLEALFWVLLWLCIRCSAPCTRRVELQSNSPKSPVQVEWNTIFEAEAMVVGKVKRSIIRYEGELEDAVFRHFTSFCAPLRQLVKDIWQVLHDAYKSDAYKSDAYMPDDATGIHVKILRCLDDAKTRLPPEDSPYNYATAPEQKDWQGLRAIHEDRRARGIDLCWHKNTPTKAGERVNHGDEPNPNPEDDGSSVLSSPTLRAAKKRRVVDNDGSLDDLTLGEPVAGPSSRKSSRGKSTARRASGKRAASGRKPDDNTPTTSANPSRGTSRGRTTRSASTRRGGSAPDAGARASGSRGRGSSRKATQSSRSRGRSSKR